MKLRLAYMGGVALAVCAPTMGQPAFGQDANVEGRVVKLEKEMRAVQRQVFPGGAGKFFEPEIKPDATGAKPVVTPSGSALTDMIARVDALESQLATVTGQVEQHGSNLRSMESRLKSLEAQVKAQASAAPTAQVSEPVPVAIAATPKPTIKPPVTTPTKPAATGKPTATGKPSASRTAAVAAIAKPATGDGFEDGYNYGYRLWESKFYPEAQTQLQETVTKYPKHKRASYARNLLGRAWLDEKKPATAVKIFYDNYKGDPRGDRAAESLYFLGVALTDLGKNTEACEAFGQLETAYPGEVAGTGRLAARLTSAKTRAKCK